MQQHPVELSDISKTYSNGHTSVTAVDNLSLHIKKGEVLCILGPNGSGKTTTLKMTCGLVTPDSGSIMIFGQHLAKHPKVLKRMGVLLDGSRNIYPYLSALENLKYYGRISGYTGNDIIERSKHLLKTYNLFDRMNDPCSTLSFGMQQKVALCCALIHNPEILLLDEPTASLDIMTKRDVIQSVLQMKKEGKSILLMTHQMDVAEKISDRIIIINRGRIVREGTPESITKQIGRGGYIIKVQEPAEQARHILSESFDAEYKNNEIIAYNCDQHRISELVRLLTDAGLTILSISVNASLEESVLRLMEESS